MKKEVKVSIIVPAYNEEKRIERCIKSLKGQLLKEIEIIVVDDGSSDNTFNICKEYEKKDSRIRVVKKENEGQGIARNYGINMANGKYIGFVDADDYIQPDMYQKLYEKCEKFNADSCMMIYRSKEGFLENRDFFKNQDIRDFIMLDMLGNNPEDKSGRKIGISACTKIYKSDIIKNNDIKFISEREVFSEDTTFNIEFLMHANSVTLLDEKLYIYVNNKESYTHRYNRGYLERVKNMYNYIINNLYNNSMNEKEYLYFTNMITMQLINCIMQEVLYYKGNYKEKSNNIKKICNDKFVRQLLKEFPYKRLPLQKRILIHAVYKKHIKRIYIFVKIKKMIKK